MKKGGVHRSTFVVLTTGLLVLLKEPLFLDWGITLWDGGCLIRVGRSSEGYQAGEGVLCYSQENIQVAVLTPLEGYLDRCHVLSEETMSVSDGGVIRFLRMLGQGEGQGQEAVGFIVG